MERFIRKTFRFLFLPILSVFLLILLFEYYLNNSSLLDNYSFNTNIESKIYKLQENTTDSLNIIIAGDSRAERQLIPQIFTSSTGINSLNIAVTAGDLASTVPALSAYSDSNIFIISASSWQINDGAIDHRYLSYNCFLQLSLFEKIRIYRSNAKELVNMYIHLLKRSLEKIIVNKNKYDYNVNIIQEHGFLGIEDTLDIDIGNIMHLINSHSWYKNLNFNGSRYRIFIETLSQLAKRNSLIIIYQPPVSPIWKEYTRNTVIDIFEKEYTKKLDSLCSKYDNIIFYDFYLQNISQLDNSMYYDYQHLNRNGAKLFTKLFAERVNIEIKARTHNRVDGPTSVN